MPTTLNRRIYDLAIAGHGPSDIAEYLNVSAKVVKTALKDLTAPRAVTLDQRIHDLALASHSPDTIAFDFLDVSHPQVLTSLQDLTKGPSRTPGGITNWCQVFPSGAPTFTVANAGFGGYSYHAADLALDDANSSPGHSFFIHDAGNGVGQLGTTEPGIYMINFPFNENGPNTLDPAHTNPRYLTFDLQLQPPTGIMFGMLPLSGDPAVSYGLSNTYTSGPIIARGDPLLVFTLMRIHALGLIGTDSIPNPDQNVDSLTIWQIG